MISDDHIDIEIIANFLQENQLWNEVFTKKKEGYYAYLS
jgi:hypothetical protein